MQQSQLTISDYSGGITDYPLDAAQNQSEELDNLLINPNKKPVSRPCFQIFDTGAYQVLDGAVRVQALLPHLGGPTLFPFSGRKAWYESSGAFTELLGPSGNSCLPAGNTSNYISFAQWNNHAYVTSDAFGSVQKIFHNASGTPTVVNAGLPDLASSPVVTAGGAGAQNYIYAFMYDYTYSVGTVSFEDQGPVTQVALASALAPNASTVAITAIPVLSNGFTENRDTTTITVQIYRTISGGTQFFKVGQVTNGTTTFNDSVSDATLVLNAALYINGGVLDNAAPPLCKFIHVVNGRAYYANVKLGSELLTNRVYESKQDDPDSVPDDSFEDFEDEITGISSFNGKVIIFGVNHTYRLEGTIDDSGIGGFIHQEISPSIGCISHQGIVQTRDGVFFPGNDGFYYTDGYRVDKISDSINVSYKALTSSVAKQKRIVGAFDKKENRVYWAVQDDPTSTDNDAFYVLDLRWGVRAASTFTTASNGTNLSPTSLCFFNNVLHHGDRRGYVFKWSELIYSDPLVDTALAATSWGSSAVRYTLKSIAHDFGYTDVRKWVPMVLFKAANRTNLSVQIQSNNDNSSSLRDLKEIRYRGEIVWGDPTVIWGDDQYIWGSPGMILVKRRFPAGTLRCSYKQIIITNAFTNIYKSDLFGVATVDSTAKTATAVLDYPSNLKGYFISFAADGYVKNFEISAQTANALTFLDPRNLCPNGSNKWLIRGYPKGESLSLLSYTLFFSPLTASQRDFKGGASETGDNT